MPPRWNTWPTIHPVQWDRKKQPGKTQVRLVAAVSQVGDPVPIRTSGVEIEGIITDASTPVLKVKVKAAAVKAKRVKSKRVRTA